MYEYLEGRVAERGAARLVLDVSGTGYELFVPVGADFPLRPGGEGERVRAYTHFSPREDAHHLYGFPDRDTRELFRLLLRAKGVGPGLALAVLSGLARRELLEAVATGDPKPFVRIKGLGRKRAEQILLDLREKATAMLAEEEARERHGTLQPAAPRTASIEDAVSALVSIGFAEREARKSVESAATQVDPNDLETLVRTALRK